MSMKAVPGYAENGGSKYVMNQKANGTYERKKISIDSDAIESLEENALPKVSSHDNGKVLGVKSGKWQKVDAPSGLPTVTGADEGKVLTVDSSGDWGAANIPSQLPAVTGADNGKFLGVSSGEWSVVSAPSGGGVLNVTDTIVEDLPNNQLVHTLNKTYTEIKTAILAGISVLVSYTMSGEEDGDTWQFSGWGKVTSFAENYTNDVFDNGGFYVSGIYDDMLVNFSVTSESGYPVYNQAIS